LVVSSWLIGGVAIAAPSDDLLKAAKAGEATAVKAALAKGASARATDVDGSTALHWAAYRGDLDVATALLRAGADPKAVNRYGIQPLSLACVAGPAGLITALLEAGADANTTQPDGETVLMTAARSGLVDSVNALLASGANVNATEPWRGQTALMWAAAEGHADVVRALAAARANIGARTKTGFSALLFAVREGRIEATRALLDSGATVSESVSVNSEETAGGVQRTDTAAAGLNALLLASGNAHFELAAFLLDRGADPNSAPRGFSALHQVSWIRKMGEAGSNDPPPEGSGRMTGLEFVRKLVAAGANVNARVTVRRLPLGASGLDFTGATPFLLAARTADVDLMKLLVDLGADPLATTDLGTTALMVAAGVGAALPGEEPGTEAEAIEAVKLAAKLGGDVNALDDNGRTAMHGAAYKHLPRMVRLLADMGARPDVWNHKDRDGHSPLEIAAGIQRGMNFVFSADTEAALRSALSPTR
jgi:ankyrin repeat protein